MPGHQTGELDFKPWATSLEREGTWVWIQINLDVNLG